jgi:hypothetical protein
MPFTVLRRSVNIISSTQPFGAERGGEKRAEKPANAGFASNANAQATFRAAGL